MQARAIWKWLLIGLISIPLIAQATSGPALKANSPKQYVVQPGDSLWSIASKYLQKPWQWEQLWRMNPQLGNPGELHPGDVINLEMHNGEVQLRVHSNSTIKLSPKMRVTAYDEVIPAVPFHLIKPFLSHDLVLSPFALKHAPYVVGTEQEHLIAGKYDFVYVYGLPVTETQEGQKFDLYRGGERLMDPDSRKCLGLLANYVGEGMITKNGGVATMRVEDAKRAILQGDRLFPATSRLPHPIMNMQPADETIQGRIIAVLEGVTQVGENDVVVINRGVHAGLKPGDLLGIYQVGDTVVDSTRRKLRGVKLPDELAGELLVFRIFDNVAFGLVLNANQALHIYDYVANLPS